MGYTPLSCTIGNVPYLFASLYISVLEAKITDLITGENVAISALTRRNAAKRPSAMGIITERTRNHRTSHKY